MRRFLLRGCATVFFACSALFAQTSAAPDVLLTTAATAPAHPAVSNGAYTQYPMMRAPSAPPFSWLTLSGGISTMGVRLQTGFYLTSTLGLRSTGGLFHYPLPSRKESGFLMNGTMDFANAGVALDMYPYFPGHGFRISPGLLLFNRNAANAKITAIGGESFTLNGVTYYSSPTAPVTGTGSLGLHSRNPAFTISAGSRNILPHKIIPRIGPRWSFPFDAGVAFVGRPTLNMTLAGGQVCTDAQGTSGCQNVVIDADVNANLQKQLETYQNELAPLRFYPMISFGVSYTFRIRGGEVY